MLSTHTDNLGGGLSVLPLKLRLKKFILFQKRLPPCERSGVRLCLVQGSHDPEGGVPPE